MAAHEIDGWVVAASRRIRSCRNGPEWPKLGGWETLAKPTGQPEVGSSDSGDTALERSGANKFGEGECHF